MKRIFGLLLLIVVIFLLSSLVLAQSGQLAIPWYTFVGGGWTSSEAAGFSLSGTIGQADAGSSADDDSFRLIGGFWNPTTSGTGSNEVFLPILQRSM
jgi:hypothetical protein